LATAFLSEGHSVMLGTRTPTKDEVQKWLKKTQAERRVLLKENGFLRRDTGIGNPGDYCF
jgi:hypothetical protein